MKFFTLFTLLFYSAVLFAQERPQGDRGSDNMPKDGVLRGKVYDADLKTPVQYANIVVKSARDGSIINGAVADEKGDFVIKDLSYGKFTVEIDFIGYKKVIKTEVLINPQSKEVDLGKIELKQSVTQLETVEVVGEKKYVEYKIDKKVINVSQDLSATGGNAVDILENTPSVQTDIDGNVSLRGSGSFTVLIDGKPSPLEGSEALQQIPASIIESIEIITNPSAKYDPDGVAGIINVILKKKKEPGFNGIVNVNADTQSGLGGDFLFNYRMSKLNLFVGAESSNGLRPGTSQSVRENYYDSITSYIVQNGERARGRYGTSLKGGLDYTFNDRHSVTFSGTYGDRGFRRSSFNKTHQYTTPELIDTNYVTDSYFKGGNIYVDINGFYLYKFKQKDHQLSVQGIYTINNGDDDDVLKQYDSDENFYYTDTDEILRQRTESTDQSINKRIQADYVKPFKKEGSKLEAGLQARIYNGKSDYQLEDYDFDTQIWVEDPSQINGIDFNQTISSVYSTYSGSFKKFEFMAGLRGEYTNREIVSRIIDTSYIVDLYDYFPTFHISRPINATLQVMASYARRIERPRDWDLDPFKNYSDPLNVRMGNPALLPEYIDSYDLSAQKKFKKGFVSLEGYHRITTNLISHISTLGADNIMYNTMANMNSDKSTGFELTGNFDFTKWFNLNSGFDFYRYKFDGEIDGIDVSDANNTWSARASLSFKLKWGTKIQVNGNYRAPHIEPQEKSEGSFMSSIAVRQDFFDRKLSVSFRVRDVFGSMKHASESWGEQYYSYSKLLSKAPVFTFSVSYKINNYKQKRSEGEGEGEGGGEDM